MAATLDQIETLLTDVNARLQSMPVQLGEDAVRALVAEALATALEDDAHELSRRMRFGGGAPELTGSKFARYGLTIGDIEFLYDLQTSLRGQPRINKDAGPVYTGPSEELESCFGAVSEAMYLPMDEVRRIDQRALDGAFPRIPKGWYQGKDRELAERGLWWLTDAYRSATQAMDSAESGFGSQLIGAQYVGELWEAARRESRIFALIPSFEMTDPTAYLPVEVDIPEMLYVSESATSSATAYTTSKTGSQRVDVTARKLLLHQMWSGELEEDSIIPFIPFLRMQAQKSVQHYSDSLVLNGDTTNTATGNINLDDADPADTKHYLALDGIRHAGLVDNTANSLSAAGAAVTYALLRGQLGRMIDTTRFVDWGHPTDPTDVVYIADPATADKIALLTEVITVDKYGSNATVLTGEVSNIARSPLISSIAMSKTEADGKVSTTGANNTLGQVVCFNRRGFVVGWRRRIKLETERIPATDQTRLVYSMRLGFGRFSPTGAASGIEAADVLYNILVA